MKIEELLKRQAKQLEEIETRAPLEELIKGMTIAIGITVVVIVLIFGVLYVVDKGGIN